MIRIIPILIGVILIQNTRKPGRCRLPSAPGRNILGLSLQNPLKQVFFVLLLNKVLMVRTKYRYKCTREKHPWTQFAETAETGSTQTHSLGKNLLKQILSETKISWSKY